MTYSIFNVTNSSFKIISNIIISFIGAGILGLPFAFKEVGLIGGIIVMISVAVLSTKAMLLVIKCKYIVGDNLFEEDSSHKVLNESTKYVCNSQKGLSCDLINYSDIGYHALGNFGKLLVDISVILSQTGFCCTYLIFVSKNIMNFYPLVTRWQCTLASITFVYFLTLFRNLGKLGYVSFVAQLSQVIAFSLILWYEFPSLIKTKFEPQLISVSGLPFFFAVSVYCFEGAGMILSLESSTSVNLRPKFKRYFIIVMFIITSIYISFGVCGYISFGAKTESVITLNLSSDNNSMFVYVIKICLCFSLLLTYPVMMFPVTQLLDKKFDITKSILKGNFLRIVLVTISALIVLIVHSFEVLMGFIGASCCSLLAFILPGLFHFKLSHKNRTKNSVILDILLVLFGFFIMTIGMWDSYLRF